jgi:hypothetical protein
MIAALFLLAFSFLLQDSQPVVPPEYGDITELKELHRVYIYTDDGQAYDRIAKELNKYKDLQVVEKISEAEFLIIFFSNRISAANYSVVNVDPGTGYGSINSKATEREIGIMKAVVPGSTPGSLRILWQAEKGTRLRFGRDPEAKCAKEFVKQLKKVKEGK